MLIPSFVGPDPEPTWGAEDFLRRTCHLPSATNSHVQIGVLSHRRFGVTTMTRLNRLLYLCVGVAWAAASLARVGAGLAVWDGSETASAAVGSVVGGVLVVTTFTAAVGWFAWKRRNWRLQHYQEQFPSSGFGTPQRRGGPALYPAKGDIATTHTPPATPLLGND
jgi:hypothetical protein